LKDIDERLGALRTYGDIAPGTPPIPRGGAGRRRLSLALGVCLVAGMVAALAIADRPSEPVVTDTAEGPSDSEEPEAPVWQETSAGWSLEAVLMDGTRLQVTLPAAFDPDRFTISSYTAANFAQCCTTSLRATLTAQEGQPSGEPSESFAASSGQVRFFADGVPPALWLEEGLWTIRASVQGFEDPAQADRRRELAEGLTPSIVEGWPRVAADDSFTMSSGGDEGQPSFVLASDTVIVTIMRSRCFDVDDRGIEPMGDQFTGVRCFDDGLRSTYQGSRDEVESLQGGLDVRLRS